MIMEMKKEIKENPENVLLVIDYDRTLVNNKKEIMEETQKQLIAFQEQGGLLALASGRPLSGLKKACDILKIDEYNGYVIAENGANVYALATNELLVSDLITSEQLENAFNELVNIPIEKGIYTENELLVTGITDDLRDEASSNRLEINLINNTMNMDPSSKIVISDPNKDTHRYYEQINDCLKDGFNVVKSSPRYIELTNKTVDKACGINYIKELLPMKVSTTIGIGDSQNDYTMLEACDYKVAMGNATDEIKMICDITIDTNEEDAIGKYLLEMSLL